MSEQKAKYKSKRKREKEVYKWFYKAVDKIKLIRDKSNLNFVHGKHKIGRIIREVKGYIGKPQHGDKTWEDLERETGISKSELRRCAKFAVKWETWRAFVNFVAAQKGVPSQDKTIEEVLSEVSIPSWNYIRKNWLYEKKVSDKTKKLHRNIKAISKNFPEDALFLSQLQKTDYALSYHESELLYKRKMEDSSRKAQNIFIEEIFPNRKQRVPCSMKTLMLIELFLEENRSYDSTQDVVDDSVFTMCQSVKSKLENKIRKELGPELLN